MAAEDTDGNAVWIATTAERGLPEPAIPAGVGELGVPGNIVVARSGRGLFRAYERGMVAWDPATGLVRWENRAVPDGVIGMATASDDGLRIAATFGTKEILLLDARTGAVTSRLRPPELQHVTRLLFDRTGRRLAAACAEHVVYVWDFAGMDDGLAALGLRR
jgi:WD40 repeat protein